MKRQDPCGQGSIRSLKNQKSSPFSFFFCLFIWKERNFPEKVGRVISNHIHL